MAGRVNDKIALVTGGGSGMGRATALAFAREGATVVVADVVGDNAEETVRLIKAAGGAATAVYVDVSQAADVQKMVQTVVDRYGRLDCAFNNAGIEGEMAPTAESSEAHWDRVIAVNLTGVWLCMKYEIAQMLTQGGGAIVNTASVAGLIGLPGVSAYVASKHGVLGLTKTAALEYAKAGIRVNAVCPGAIHTPMYERAVRMNPQFGEALLAVTPVARIGRPEEVAEAAVWLCSDAASFVTGLPMVVDGGWTAH